MTGQLVK